jgi:hypothetical protein
MWDPTAAADTVFGFNNWLLWEYDKWIDSLPLAQRKTATGKNKKEMVRASLQSYNNHSVPPNFNLNPRIRVMIADDNFELKYRGGGKWKNFATRKDIAEAFHKMLPRDPSADYQIISISYEWDNTSSGIRGSSLPGVIHKKLQEEYKTFRAFSAETDFNFGKMGLEYYLYSKMLWSPLMKVAKLKAIRDRWLRRAFGSGWREMQGYYKFMAPENFINVPNTWAKAIRIIAAADAKIDGAKEPDAQRRLDDLKQFWYFYYLLESGQNKPDSRPFQEFVWKGQMSYMTAMHMVARRFFAKGDVKEAAGREFNKGRAHYTREETQAWWAKILASWEPVPVAHFAEATLADGRKGRTVDVNDLVMVAEFQDPDPTKSADDPFQYNSGSETASFLTVATRTGQPIGFKLWWPWKDRNGAYYRARDVFYGISRWDPAKKSWVDKITISKHSETIELKSAWEPSYKDGNKWQLVEARYVAPQTGTYSIELGSGGQEAHLTTLDYDPVSGEYAGAPGHTYFTRLVGLTQPPVYFYIPKGTKSLDMEAWDTSDNKQLHLYMGLPTTGWSETRAVDVSKRGTYPIVLNPGEDGSIAELSGNGFAFPHLYSVPMLWAKRPAALLVPRAVAKADGLTVKE